MAALTLIIVGKYFVPIFLKNGIYTMPEYLGQRYDSRVRAIMAVFWLFLYTFVNLTSILWLGALAINTVTGLPLMWAMIGLGAFTVGYSLYGGLKAVALTDIIQVTLLVLGGLVIGYIALDRIAEGAGALAGFKHLLATAPEKFDMILSRDNPHYKDLPGISVLIGGMWIMNISYWGFNQYIIQRALGAKSIQEAQKGIAFAAYLKLLMPVIVVLPGIAAVTLAPGLSRPDQAYPALMKLLPSGLLGLVLAALIAAIVASLASRVNSIATIFTVDVYARMRPQTDERHRVIVGRVAAITAVVIGVLAAKPLLGGFEQGFQYIQEYTGFVTPGICVIFLLGMFWKRMTANAALIAAIGSVVLSATLKGAWPQLPFIDRVGLVFVLSALLGIVVSLAKPDTSHGRLVEVQGVGFATTAGFNLAAVGVIVILTVLYATWW
jgi:SSS family solute:Na+ symporter